MKTVFCSTKLQSDYIQKYFKEYTNIYLKENLNKKNKKDLEQKNKNPRYFKYRDELFIISH